jgi:hypothetical protein
MEILTLTKTLTPTGEDAALNLTYRDVEGKAQSLTVAKDGPAWAPTQKLLTLLSTKNISREAFVTALVMEADLAKKAAEKISRVTGVLDGAMTIKGGRVYVDHEPIDSVLEHHILNLLREDGTPNDDRNWTAFAKFVDKLFSNTSAYIRDQFFGWLEHENINNGGFTLTEDGNVLGYKGCAGTIKAPVSISHGPAIVDGVAVTGAVPNNPGSLVEIERSRVVDNPKIGCASGLHVGTHGYAKGWSKGVLLTVEFNPKDIVSVPTDCNAQKIRVSRYRVLEAIDAPVTTYTYSAPAPRGPVDNPDYIKRLTKASNEGHTVRFGYNGKAREGTVNSKFTGKGGVVINLFMGDKNDHCEIKSFCVRKMSNLITDPQEFAALNMIGKYVSFDYNNEARTGLLGEVRQGRKGTYIKVKHSHLSEVKSYRLSKVTNLSLGYATTTQSLNNTPKNKNADSSNSQASIPLSKMYRLMHQEVLFLYNGVLRTGRLHGIHGSLVTVQKTNGSYRSYRASGITDMTKAAFGQN